MFNPKSLNLAEVIKHHADIEAQIECQLYSDPEEKNHLDFTPTPPIPKVEIREIKGRAGLKTFIQSFAP